MKQSPADRNVFNSTVQSRRCTIPCLAVSTTWFERTCFTCSLKYGEQADEQKRSPRHVHIPLRLFSLAKYCALLWV